MLHTNIERRTLHFRQKATTSRGAYDVRHIWLVSVADDERPGAVGTGECAPLPDLSPDAMPDADYELLLLTVCDDLRQTGAIDREALLPYPSVLFGLETALWQMERSGSAALSSTPFARGEEGIRINGLVWMGSFDEMMRRMEEKVANGFRCVKLKIGGIDFAQELKIVEALRREFDRSQVEIRLDANGAFAPQDAMRRLEALAKFDIHSIEQPIRQGQWDAMARLCETSPIDIALDEELIGLGKTEDKEAMLKTIGPRHIVVKPTLHGGLSGAREWVGMARGLGIGSWLTSALESNVGLNAIAHLAAETYGSADAMPQGLGTGQLFTDNIPMPLAIRGERLFYTPSGQ